MYEVSKGFTDHFCKCNTGFCSSPYNTHLHMQDSPLPKLQGHLLRRSSHRSPNKSVHVLQLWFTSFLCDRASLLQVSLLSAGISGSCLTAHSSLNIMHVPKSFRLLGTLCKHQHSKQQPWCLPFKGSKWPCWRNQSILVKHPTTYFSFLWNILTWQVGFSISAVPQTYFIPVTDKGKCSLSPILACSYWPAPWMSPYTEDGKLIS